MASFKYGTIVGSIKRHQLTLHLAQGSIYKTMIQTEKKNKFDLILMDQTTSLTESQTHELFAGSQA